MRVRKRQERRKFWEAIRKGASRAEARLAAGIGVNTADRWFLHAGGVLPPKPGISSDRYLSIGEREEILVGVERGLSIRQLAKTIGRAPSTVFRELRRNMRQSYRAGQGPGQARETSARILRWDYHPALAHERAQRCASRPKVAKLAANQSLRALVQAKLEDRLSPEQIAAELRREYPDDACMWVSHETVYQSIYVQGRGALRRELAVCLRSGRAIRKPGRKGQERRPHIPGMVNISERPAEIEDRAVPGHWEGDLIIGKNGLSAIGTLVERSTRYLMLLHLPDGHTPAQVEQAMVAATKRLPEMIWKSLTWDQGVEMRHHAQISISTGLDIYFCDPAKPWQRGSNENTNGLLRQYFPKATDLSVHSAEHLDFVSAQMNRRPRKTLGWVRPAAALLAILSESRPAPVASID